MQIVRGPLFSVGDTSPRSGGPGLNSPWLFVCWAGEKSIWAGRGGVVGAPAPQSGGPGFNSRCCFFLFFGTQRIGQRIGWGEVPMPDVVCFQYAKAWTGRSSDVFIYRLIKKTLRVFICFSDYFKV